MHTHHCDLKHPILWLYDLRWRAIFLVEIFPLGSLFPCCLGCTQLLSPSPYPHSPSSFSSLFRCEPSSDVHQAQPPCWFQLVLFSRASTHPHSAFHPHPHLPTPACHPQENRTLRNVNGTTKGKKDRGLCHSGLCLVVWATGRGVLPLFLSLWFLFTAFA